MTELTYTINPYLIGKCKKWMEELTSMIYEDELDMTYTIECNGRCMTFNVECGSEGIAEYVQDMWNKKMW